MAYNSSFIKYYMLIKIFYTCTLDVYELKVLNKYLTFQALKIKTKKITHFFCNK